MYGQTEPELKDTPVPEGQTTYVTADDPVDDARQAHAALVLSRVLAAKEFWKPRFKQMLDDQKFARGKQWEQLGVNLSSKTMYTANVVQRHIQQRTASLYAKNPKFVASPKRKMDYTVWDGKQETVTEAQMQLAQAMTAGTPDAVDPNLLAILQDYNRVMIRREQLRRIGLTLELLFDHYVGEQAVPFKKQMKRLVRRVLTTGVGYVRLGYQRVMEVRPEIERQISDAAVQMATIERLAREHAAGDFDDVSAEYDRLKVLLENLRQQPGVLAREGLVFHYPSSTAIIPDAKCTSLDGFQGCDWVAEEFYLTPAAIKEIWDVDITTGYRQYVCIEKGRKEFRALSSLPIDGKRPDGEDSFACVYVVYSKRDGLVYEVCEGYPNFLKEPAPPEIQLERFWPIFTLLFNEADDEEDPFPLSDVFLLRHPQYEYNRARQGLREQRAANRPKTYVGADRLSEDDKGKLQTHPANAVIELEGLQPGEKVEDLLQPHKPPAIDPALYETNTAFDDTMRVVGTQEANLGGTSNATATESSIAESSRLSSLDSNVDDLDELLTELARAGGQVLMLNCSMKTVRKIVGEGAVWPELAPADVVEELMLTVAAGSSGRPNQAQEIQNFERVAPLLLQIPGIKPEFLAREGLQRLDDKLDLADAFQPMLPSIMQLNAQKQPAGAGGDASSDPNQQGALGAANAPQPSRPEGDTPGVGRPPMDPNLDRGMDSLG